MHAGRHVVRVVAGAQPTRDQACVGSIAIIQSSARSRSRLCLGDCLPCTLYASHMTSFVDRPDPSMASTHASMLLRTSLSPRSEGMGVSSRTAREMPMAARLADDAAHAMVVLKPRRACSAKRMHLHKVMSFHGIDTTRSRDGNLFLIQPPWLQMA